jgi:hypothetical protein
MPPFVGAGGGGGAGCVSATSDASKVRSDDDGLTWWTSIESVLVPAFSEPTAMGAANDS